MNCIHDSADLVFAPTPAFTRFSEDLLLRYAMITAASCSAAYVDPFARTWPGFSTTDPDSSYILYGPGLVGKWFFVEVRAAAWQILLMLLRRKCY